MGIKLGNEEMKMWSERSTDSLTIRIKPSVKKKLKELASLNGIKMAEQIEHMTLITYEKHF